MQTLRAHHFGFTLVETIIYIGLFSILFSGLFASIYPFFTNAERLTNNILIEGESAFIMGKIRYALADVFTSSNVTVSTATGLTVRNTGTGSRFEIASTVDTSYCTPPLTCKMLIMKSGSGEFYPLNTERVEITDFKVVHTAPSGGAQRSFEVSFKANGASVTPMVFYTQF